MSDALNKRMEPMTRSAMILGSHTAIPILMDGAPTRSRLKALAHQETPVFAGCPKPTTSRRSVRMRIACSHTAQLTRPSSRLILGVGPKAYEHACRSRSSRRMANGAFARVFRAIGSIGEGSNEYPGSLPSVPSRTPGLPACCWRGDIRVRAHVPGARRGQPVMGSRCRVPGLRRLQETE
jgi:hypothetical protein